ncbi:unnamed protein product [Linum trigynum]|uniref:Glycosyltransferase n=1 Tax=Linum trigynum TaxID=586398 RepID=A0AAV2EHE7_9ROSI
MAKNHVIIFPFMAQGHTLPLLDLAKSLSSHNLRVTVVTTPSNAKSISDSLPPANHPNISLAVIPFPAISGLPEGTENTSQLPSMQEFLLPFLHATKKLQKPFERILAAAAGSDVDRPLCVVSDFFLAWTLDTCRAFDVPRLVFHGMSVCAMALSKSLWCAAPQLVGADGSQPLDVPNMNLPFDLTVGEVPWEIMVNGIGGPENPFVEFMEEVGWADVNSWGVVVNSFEELELSHIPALESFYRDGARAWCLGPLFLCDQAQAARDKSKEAEGLFELSRWLDERVVASGSVMYVSFGTQADVSSAQLDELAHGLEMSGVPFVWVVRAGSWSVPEGLEERIEGRGLILRKWVDQRYVLGHRAVGGFLSHCGWNSMLESISTGVPILAWPMMAEQPFNAKLIVEGLEAGLRIEATGSIDADGVVFKREAICRGVRELMGGAKGRRARDRARALGRVAHRAVGDGGSSRDAMTRLISELREC